MSYIYTRPHPCLALRLANASGLWRPFDHSIPNAIMLSLLLFDLVCTPGLAIIKGLLLVGATLAGAGAGEATCCWLFGVVYEWPNI